MRKRLPFLVLILMAAPAVAGTLVLKRAWIEQFKDRATIDATFTVDHAHKKPNAPAADGDIHVAGRAPKEVGLPMVAEVMNAAAPEEQSAIKLIHTNEGSGKFVSITGAWRLWFEHPADSQTQFASVPVAANTNPDHSFEIHPITKFNGSDVAFSLHFVPGFASHDAPTSFTFYEKQTVAIRATATAVTLDAKKSQYNYTHFRMHLLGTPVALKDGGLAVLANVMDDQNAGDEALASKIRMIFVPGTPPHQKVKGSGDGDEFDALGIPRVNLNAISAFIKAGANVKASRKLPYEIIVVGLQDVK